jgi:hypothetical protein
VNFFEPEDLFVMRSACEFLSGKAFLVMLSEVSNANAVETSRTVSRASPHESARALAMPVPVLPSAKRSIFDLEGSSSQKSTPC